MENYKLAEGEARFADIIWENEPITSPDLVKLCEKKLNWKKSTTYTVLKKLCDRQIFQNNQAVVTSLITKEEFYSFKSYQFVEDTFDGSLPQFIAAFTRHSKLKAQEIHAIKEMIEKYEEDTNHE